MDKKLSHFPVMVNEIISFIKPQNNGVYLDCTFGQGGYTKAIFKKSENPYANKKNQLTDRQVKKRKRLIKYKNKLKK